MRIESNIRVTTEVVYLEESSDHDDNQHVFGCTINIENNADEAAQLVRRYWVITDGTGQTQQDSGFGVAGESPCIEPNKSHQYLSVSVLDSPVGSMHGHYEFEMASGESVLVPVAAFSLAKPGVVN